jgi:hypothetical protein
MLLPAILQNGKLRLKKCKPFILALCLFLALTLTLGSTLAWFTSFDFVVNTVNHEPAPETRFSVEVVDVFNPGQDIKQVGAVNDGQKDAFVRVFLLPVLVLTTAEGDEVLPVTYGYPGGTGEHNPAAALVIINDFNLAAWDGSAWDGGDWADGGDGYYYYLRTLPPGHSTDTDYLDQNLFNSVSVNWSALPAEWEGATLRLEVKAEGVGTGKYGWRDAWWDGSTPAAAPLNHVDAWLDGLE